MKCKVDILSFEHDVKNLTGVGLGDGGFNLTIGAVDDGDMYHRSGIACLVAADV